MLGGVIKSRENMQSLHKNREILEEDKESKGKEPG
jgi:hypothetical protein